MLDVNGHSIYFQAERRNLRRLAAVDLDQAAVDPEHRDRKADRTLRALVSVSVCVVHVQMWRRCGGQEADMDTRVV